MALGTPIILIVNGTAVRPGRELGFRDFVRGYLDPRILGVPRD